MWFLEYNIKVANLCNWFPIYPVLSSPICHILHYYSIPVTTNKPVLINYVN